MTNILINESREIRYMSYVPEESQFNTCKTFSTWDGSPAICMCKVYGLKTCRLSDSNEVIFDRQAYQSALEKAKRESMPFQDEIRIMRLMLTHYGVSSGENLNTKNTNF